MLAEKPQTGGQASAAGAGGSGGGASGSHWRGTVLNSIHNGSNPAELARIRAEHPGEADCAWNDRVLGFLAPTRGGCLVVRRVRHPCTR